MGLDAPTIMMSIVARKIYRLDETVLPIVQTHRQMFGIMVTVGNNLNKIENGLSDSSIKRF